MNLYAAFTPPVLFVSKNLPMARYYLSLRYPDREVKDLRMIPPALYTQVLSDISDYVILSRSVVDLIHPKLF